MENNVAAKGEAYYKLISEKDAQGIKQHLHPDVGLYGPLAALKGRDAVIKATTNFMKMLSSLKIRTKFGSGDQALIVYDTHFPNLSNSVPAASLLTFRDNLIVKIELFYDGSSFVQKREEIFTQ